MRYRITPPDTVGLVPGERRYDEECADHAREILRQWVKVQGGEEAAGKALGVHQSTINRALSMTSQPTLKVLIPLAEKLHWSLDQVLGLKPPPPPPPVLRVTDSEVTRIAEKVAHQVARRFTPPPMPAIPQAPRLPPGPLPPRHDSSSPVENPPKSPKRTGVRKKPTNG